MRFPVRLVVPALALGVGAALVALPGGCNRKTPQTPATVRGAVAFQGRLLNGGLVVFAPDTEKGSRGKPVRGEIGPDGRYELRLDGASPIPPGWYRVTIAAAPTSALDAPFPPQLARPDLSGLVREVKPGQENVFDFSVELPGG